MKRTTKFIFLNIKLVLSFKYKINIPQIDRYIWALTLFSQTSGTSVGQIRIKIQ
tara:strand:- start:218 stop:379 length:162 start_codon:yes stop_codon:yes gene_type:complete